MKLVTMKKFVFYAIGTPMSEKSQIKLNRIYKYAKFLDQKLELWMFVPCDENGNVLEEPEIYSQWVRENFNDELENEERINQCKEFIKAKEKVLFEGFEVLRIDRNLTIITNKEKDCQVFGKHDDDYSISVNFTDVESLSKIDLQLTQSAKNQIF